MKQITQINSSQVNSIGNVDNQYYPGLCKIVDNDHLMIPQDPRVMWDSQELYKIETAPIISSGQNQSISSRISSSVEEITRDYSSSDYQYWTGININLSMYSWPLPSGELSVVPITDTESGVTMEPDFSSWVGNTPTVARTAQYFVGGTSGIVYYNDDNKIIPGIGVRMRIQFTETITQSTVLKLALTIQRKNGDYFVNQIPVTINFIKNE